MMPNSDLMPTRMPQALNSTESREKNYCVGWTNRDFSNSQWFRMLLCIEV